MKSGFFSFCFYLIFVVVGFVYLHHDLKQSMINKEKITQEKLLANISTLIQETNETLDMEKISHVLNTFIQTTPLKAIRFKFKEYSFGDETLIKRIKSIDSSWQIIDVTTDANFGEIIVSDDGKYQFIPRVNEEFFGDIFVKFQAVNGKIISNYTVDLGWDFVVGKEEGDFDSIENDNYLLEYSFNELENSNIAKEYTLKFLTFFVLSAVFAIGIMHFYYKFVLRRNVFKEVSTINDYLVSVVEQNFQRGEGISFTQKEFSQLYDNISLLAKKFAQTINELNVNRDILEKREITDELTGLPNKKLFDKDLKHMFALGKDGYIVYLKIDNLGQYTKKYGGDIVNSLIEDFAKVVNEYFIKKRDINGKSYRFIGAEFGIIVYTKEAQIIRNILDEIISLTNKLSEKYYFFDNRVYYGGAPFDKYGTVESILQSAKSEYQIAYEKDDSFYEVVDLNEQLKKNKALEKNVKDIIARNDFALQYIQDTYDFDEEPKLLLQEISPMLIDDQTFDRFPIGVFISVAEKMNLAMEFDKLLIEKVLAHIEMGELTHDIAINISVGSFTSVHFISWLNSIMMNEKNAEKIVLTATAYSVAGNFDKFKRFTEAVKDYGAKIMIKRFDVNDLPLDKLKQTLPTYLRVEKDSSNDIKRDVTKQHKIKQILLFAEEHGVKVLGDNVKSDVDYQTIERLGFYGTSR